MSDFIPTTTVEIEEAKRRKFLETRKKVFNSIPSVPGVYILTFPNGRQYIGQTKDLRAAISRHLKNLFPSLVTIYRRRRNSENEYCLNWYKKCRDENPDLKTYEGVKFEYYEDENPVEKEKEILSKYSKKDLKNFYNTSWGGKVQSN